MGREGEENLLICRVVWADFASCLVLIIKCTSRGNEKMSLPKGQFPVLEERRVAEERIRWASGWSSRL